MTDLWGDGSGVLLDLGSDTNTDFESLSRLTEAAASAMSLSINTVIGCAAVLVHSKRNPISAANNPESALLARIEQDDGAGPTTEALRGALPIVLSDVSTDFRWPAYQRKLKALGCHGVLAVPLQLDADSSGVLTFFAPEKNVLTPRAIAKASALAVVASRSLDLSLSVRAALAATGNLRTALEGRTPIDVACGVIMAQNRCSYDEAFAILSKASSHRNIKVRKVAEGLLEGLPGGAPEAHFRS